MSPTRQPPAYVQVAETIKGRILNSHYQVGDFISAAKDLEKEFGVSNITIRKALDVLAREGYLIPKQGVGTQVALRQEELVEIEITGDFWEWFDSASGKRPRLEVDVLDIELVACPARIREILSLDPRKKIWRMRRIRRFHGHPISYYLNYGPPRLLEKALKRDFEKQTFLRVFQETCGIKLSRMEQRVRASVADIDLSRTLDVHFGDPLFFVENIYYSHERRAVAVTHMYYRGDRYVYKATLDF